MTDFFHRAPATRPAGTLILAGLLALVPTTAPAQATKSSGKHVLLQSEANDGATSRSSGYVLHGSLGGGPITVPSNSTNYKLEGGFPSTLATSTPVRPWLTAVRPQVSSLNAPGSLTLHGTNLDMGLVVGVKIGATTVRVTSRQRDQMAITIPALTVPGWQAVTLTTSMGETTIPKGLAVLPLIETRPAAGPLVPFDLVFRGSKGDRVIWVLGVTQGPLIRLPGIRYGFGLAPPNFILYAGFTIQASNGELRLGFPATLYPVGQVLLQSMFIGNSAPYGPAAFSNILRI